MPRGGARPGAGRKAGKKSGPSVVKQVRKAITAKWRDGDLSPLDVLLSSMHEAHDEGQRKEAAMYANMAAPYIHPRLSAVNTTLTGDLKASLQIVSEFPDAG